MSTNTLLILENQSQDSKKKAEQLRLAARKAWTPPPRISVAAWADKYRRLAREAGSNSGKWSTETVEIARGPMLAVTESGVHTITIMCCTQLMKTAFIENVFGYLAHLDPCPILLVRPKDEDAEDFSKERIAPMIRSTPVLRELIGVGKSRTSDETLTFKSFPGGFIALVGAGSPTNLASRPIRVILADEIDKYPVTREGDPIALAEERTATFGANWLSIRACSPTIEDESRIAHSYEESDQRKASVVCPHCDHRQFLDFFKHVQWDKDGNVHKTKTARIYCECCGVGWSEGDRLRSLKTARWHQTKAFTCCGSRHVPLEDYAALRDDERAVRKVWEWSESDRHAVYLAKCPDCGNLPVENIHAGFHAGKLYSPWQKDKPSDIAAKWISSKDDPDRAQTWWNTQMGLPHRPHSGKVLHIDTLLARCEVWDSEVPDGVAVITAGIDVQDYRIEIEMVGWGRNEESWSIDYHVIDGEFEEPSVRARLDEYLKKLWRRADGRGFETMAACIDSGGHHTQKVYEFARARLGRRVWAIKGESARSGQRSPVWPTKKPTSRTKATFRPVILGVNAAKDTIRTRLHLDQAGPGYMHFSTDRDIGYFAQLTAERSVVKEVSGQRFRVWELPPGKANEALDCRVYAYGALCGLLHFGLQLNKRSEAVIAPPPPSEVIPQIAIPPAASPAASPQKPRSVIARLA